MELPITDKELATIVSALLLGGDTSLYQKLKKIKDIRDANPGGPYKKIAREEFGFVLWLRLSINLKNIQM